MAREHRMYTLVRSMSRSRERPARRPRKLLGRVHTRQALIEGALELLDGDKSFDGLSLRELTRAVGIVPTAFYRHFRDMEELGLALVEESFRALRRILEDLRKESRPGSGVIAAVLKSLVKQIRAQRPRFRFIASERYGGVESVRSAIRREMRLFQSELATDLARFPPMRDWTTPDLQMLSALMVNSMVAIAEEILDRGEADKHAEAELMRLAEQQLRLILLAVPQWRPSAPGA